MILETDMQRIPDPCSIYWIMPMNKVVYDTIDEGEIRMWRFGLQNGKYIFAEPNGINNFHVLTSSLGSPFSEDG